MDRLRPAHPGFWPDAAHPIDEAWDEAEILTDMLFADQPDRNEAAGGKDDRRAEKPLQHYIDRHPNETTIDNVMVQYNSH